MIAFVGTCVDKLDALDIAGLNAGIAVMQKPFWEQQVEEYDKIMRVNARRRTVLFPSHFPY